MNPFLLQFANGHMLFVGFALSVCAYGLRLCCSRRVLRTPLTVTAITGGLLVLLSGTPYPLWGYAAWFACLAACVLAFEMSGDHARRSQRIAVSILAVLSVAMTVIELPYHRKRSLAFPKDKPLVVIGDSLAMAVELRAEAWPEALGKMAGLEVRNLAVGGNTVGGALGDARRIRNLDCSVLLEIGGNDLLGGSGARQFEADLGALVSEVCKKDRLVAMFELPLFPFRSEFGRIQRHHAKAHGIVLIPKRIMTTVLGTPGSTVDGLHLSNRGHAAMASALNAMTIGGLP